MTFGVIYPAQTDPADVPFIAAAASTTPPRTAYVQQSRRPNVQVRSHVTQSRWPGYQWVGLPPVTPRPRQTVQDSAAVWQPRFDHRRGSVVAPPVQAAAASATAPPVLPRPRQIIVTAAALQPGRRDHAARIIEPAVQVAAAVTPTPTTTPLPRQIVILARPAPRQARSGHIIQPRPVQGSVTPPRTVTTKLCGAAPRRQHGGHVVAARPNTQPVTPTRQRVVQATAQRRARRGQVIRQGPQMAKFGTAAPATTLVTTPMSGVVEVGDHALPAAGDTGLVKTGDSAFPQI